MPRFAGESGLLGGSGGKGRAIMLNGSPGVPAANPRTGTVYVPIQCTTGSCTTPEHVVDIINAATCNAQVISGCQVVARAQVGSNPFAAAVDQKADTIYVANQSGTVSVLDGARCNAKVTNGCAKAPLATIKVGKTPFAATFNPATQTVYVANFTSGNVSVINAATCNATTTQGCRQPPRTVRVGAGPDAIDVDVATDTIYVANEGLTSNGNTVSVIDGATCNGSHGSGCGQKPHTVTLGSPSINPFWLAVDQARDTVYVANYLAGVDGGNVSVINGARCNAKVTSGCGRTPPTVRTGNGAAFVEVDQALHTAFVMNQFDDTLSAVNTRTCSGTVTSGCLARPPNQQATFNPPQGFPPNSFALMQRTATAYLANVGGPNIISVVSIRHCNATSTSGCRAEAPAVSNPVSTVTADPATNTIYAGNQTLPEIDVLNGATCHAAGVSGCAPVATIPMTDPQASLGTIDHSTGTLYASDPSSGTVAVINTATCNAANTSGCAQHPPTIKIGPGPSSPSLNQATGTLYVPYGSKASRVAVINAATCNAQNTTGCGQTPAVANVGQGTFALAVSTATDTIYAPNHGLNFNGDTVSVLNGATCNAANHSGCGHLAATVKVGLAPYGIAVNDKTHTAYVANNGQEPGTVSLINTATCNASDTSGCAQRMPTVPVGQAPIAPVLDTATGTIYLTDFASAAVSLLNGSRCNAETTTGCHTRPPQQAVGSGPSAIAVNQQSRTIYVALTSAMSIFGTACDRH
jgi:YVTN family beta-propeller protein